MTTLTFVCGQESVHNFVSNGGILKGHKMRVTWRPRSFVLALHTLLMATNASLSF